MAAITTPDSSVLERFHHSSLPSPLRCHPARPDLHPQELRRKTKEAGGFDNRLDAAAARKSRKSSTGCRKCESVDIGRTVAWAKLLFKEMIARRDDRGAQLCAVSLFHEMLRHGFKPNSSSMEKVGNALISMYDACGNLEDLEKEPKRRRRGTLERRFDVASQISPLFQSTETVYFVIELKELKLVVGAVRGTETPEDLFTDGLGRECILADTDYHGLLMFGRKSLLFAHVWMYALRLQGMMLWHRFPNVHTGVLPCVDIVIADHCNKSWRSCLVNQVGNCYWPWQWPRWGVKLQLEQFNQQLQQLDGTIGAKGSAPSLLSRRVAESQSTRVLQNRNIPQRAMDSKFLPVSVIILSGNSMNKSATGGDNSY
ncbi:hypothetical protein SELMODRAFT_448914 [Selaginella moellendorffii]|uniref:Uncharacterized protein n=1 Tax=Selaginella moellendorffii TaxID=88036 RepID=D8TB54_SELML|nr:hypothetical protein SELMODRAFT_448914 [Selaginella moellendorffii]